MNIKNNSRVQRTRQKMQHAFLQLIEEMPLEQVNVSELCRRAGVNRSTFYAHYDGIPDLMLEIQQDIGHSLSDAFAWLHNPGEEFATMRAFTTMLEHILRHKRFYRAYVNCSLGQQYLALGRSYQLEELIRPYSHRQGLTYENWIDYAYEAFQAGCLAIVRRWLEQDCPEPPAEMARILYFCVAHGELYAASEAKEKSPDTGSPC